MSTVQKGPDDLVLYKDFNGVLAMLSLQNIDIKSLVESYVKILNIEHLLKSITILL